MLRRFHAKHLARLSEDLGESTREVSDPERRKQCSTVIYTYLDRLAVLSRPGIDATSA
jgi:hypothetical protein